MKKIGLISFPMLVHGAVISNHWYIPLHQTFEGKGQTMPFRDLARAVSGSAMNKHKSHVRASLLKRKKELQKALAAVEAGLRHLSAPKGRAKKG